MSFRRRESHREWREPMWYCHECNAEMRPLMMPDPHCASCRGTFVEKIENLDDDPREFQNAVAIDLPDDLGALGLSEMLEESVAQAGLNRNDQRPSNARNDSSFRGAGFRVEFGSTDRPRVITFGGPNVLERRGDGTFQPTNRLSEIFRSAGTEQNADDIQDPTIPGQIMAQYIMTLLSGIGGRGGSPFLGPTGRGTGEQGRWGDYVFTQEALDQIITQMMESANASRPVPASDETVSKLPKEVLLEGSPLLEKDCAICKDQFSVKAEEPDDQVIVTLPCKHPFHETCIIPWLKSSGTCPVCRFALAPQPNSRPSDPGAPPNGRPSSSEESNRDNEGGSSTSSAQASGSHGSGFFSSLFSHNRSGSNSSNQRHASNTRSDERRRDSDNRHDGRDRRRIPGGWIDSFD